MLAHPTPDAIRTQAMAIIAARLQRTAAAEERLAAFANVIVIGVLMDLETAFDIGLEVDEALPDGTVGGLLDLVVRRAMAPPPWRLRRLCGPSARIYDLASERTRRAQGAPRAEVA